MLARGHQWLVRHQNYHPFGEHNRGRQVAKEHPPVQRDRGWSMEELVARLSGRYTARPHPMHVGQVLRALGWAQKRDWTRDGGGRRVWQLGDE